jgi:D-3-phosphoglycerate dehydrogenase
MLRLLVAESEGFNSAARTSLDRRFHTCWADIRSRRELLGQVPHYDILWVRLRHQIDSEVFDAAPSLRYVVTNTTGLNHIDTLGAAERRISVLSLRGEGQFLSGVRATAEHTIALCLALMRQIPAAARHTSEGYWNRYLFKGNELAGRRIGVVGYGRLGRLVAQYAQAFEMDVVASDPHTASDGTVPLLTLEELLYTSDIVTLHVSLSPETEGLFGVRQFSAMKNRAWFINTARGELVDEYALIQSLRSKKLAGAAVDVVRDEGSLPATPNPLIEYSRIDERLIVTPHIGGYTEESLWKTEEFMTAKLIAATVG